MTTPSGGGRGESLGSATGEIVINYDPKGIAQAQRDLESLGKTAKGHSKDFTDLGKGLAGAGAVMATGLVLAVRSAAQFEQQLSNVKAVSGATEGQMEQLRKKALQLGKDTKFSASESASAMEELVKAGLTVEEVLNGAADATVALAAAGEVGMAEAATIASNAMNQFQLAAEELPGVANAIAGAANASAIDVSQFGYSLSQAGAVANLAGANFKDTATAIALLGNAGIVGSDAGTSLKSMLNNLNPVTEKQIKLSEELGLLTKDGTNAFYDQNGSLKSLAEVSGILQQALAGMTDQQKQMKLETLFGADAIRAASVLAEQGADGFNEMTAAMARTSAADVAATKMDNLNGSIEQLKGSFETLLIVMGTPFLGGVRTVVDGLNKLLGVFLILPGPVQELIGLLGSAATVIALLGGAALIMAPKVRAARVELQAFAASATYARIASGFGLITRTLGPWGLAIGAATAALGFLFLRNKGGERSVEDLTEAIKADTEAMGENTRTAVANRLQKQGVLDIADKLGISLADLTGAVMGEVGAQTRLDAAMSAANAPLQEQIDALTLRIYNSGGMNEALENERAALEAQQAALGKLTGAYNSNSEDMQTARTVADQLKRSQDAVTQAANDETNALNNQLARALGITNQKAREASGGTKGLKTDVKALGTDAAATEKQIKAMNDAIQALFNAAFAAPRALETFKSGLNALKDQVSQNGTKLKGFSDNAIENREAVRRNAEAIGEFASALRENGEAPDVVARKVAGMKRELEDAAVAAGFDRDEVKKLTDVLNQLPGVIDVDVNANTDQAQRDAELLKTTIENIPANKTVHINTTGGINALEQAGLNPDKLARGGIVTRATLAVIGEGRSSEAVIPLPDLAEQFLRIYQAGQVNTATLEAGRRSTGQATQLRNSTGLRLLRGSLDISSRSQAVISGWAEDVYAGEDEFASTYGRM